MADNPFVGLSDYESQVLQSVLLRLRIDAGNGYVWNRIIPDLGDGRYMLPLQLPKPPEEKKQEKLPESKQPPGQEEAAQPQLEQKEDESRERPSKK